VNAEAESGHLARRSKLWIVSRRLVCTWMRARERHRRACVSRLARRSEESHQNRATTPWDPSSRSCAAPWKKLAQISSPQLIAVRTRRAIQRRERSPPKCVGTVAQSVAPRFPSAVPTFAATRAPRAAPPFPRAAMTRARRYQDFRPETIAHDTAAPFSRSRIDKSMTILVRATCTTFAMPRPPTPSKRFASRSDRDADATDPCTADPFAHPSAVRFPPNGGRRTLATFAAARAVKSSVSSPPFVPRRVLGPDFHLFSDPASRARRSHRHSRLSLRALDIVAPCRLPPRSTARVEYLG